MLNISKYIVVTFNSIKNPIVFNYALKDQRLIGSDTAQHLSIAFDCDLALNNHIQQRFLNCCMEYSVGCLL